VEPNLSHAPLATKSIERFDSPISIHVHSIRKRLTDPDGISCKAVIDGLVHSGILIDDSPTYVKEVTYSQEKGKVEKTIITIGD
tara:strand:- start:243 stop:494 length:252 start_codon:yes stop_codon:yes gene_type:complete